MNKMRLCVDNFYPFVKTYSLYSTFYIKVNDIYFPSTGWTDLTSSVLDMWLSDLSRFLLGHYENTVLHFMDGDYKIELRWITQDAATAYFIKSDTILAQADIDLLYFTRQLLSAVGKISKNFAEYTDEPQIVSLLEKAATLKLILVSVSK